MPNPKRPEPDWAVVRADYEGGRGTVAEIIARHATSSKKLLRIAKLQKWRMRRASQSPPSRPGRKQGDIVRRLNRLVAINLQRMENVMSSNDPASPIDNERETRAIGKLIQNIERVSEIETDNNRGSKNRIGDKRGDAGPLSPEETQRLSLELADRLYKLARSTKPGAAD